VSSENKDGFPTPALSSQSEIPDLSAPQYFFGGLSPGFEPRVTLPQSFLGCMSDLQITQETYNPFRGRNWGVQKTCSEKVSEYEQFQEKMGRFTIMAELNCYPLLAFTAGDSCRLQRKWIFRVDVVSTKENRLV